MTTNDWRPVCYSADCDEDGICPTCGLDYSESDCPGPTQDGMDFEWRDGVLYARPSPEVNDAKT